MVRFKLREKILLSSVLLAVIPITVTSVSLWLQANSQSKLAIEEQVEDRLLALNEIKKNQIQGYFQQLHKQIRSYSTDPLTVVIMQSLDQNFKKDISQISDIEGHKTELSGYYKAEVQKTFAANNGQAFPGIESVLGQFDNATISFQHSYIVSNEAPFGEKFNLRDPDDGKLYNNEHATRHPQMLDLLNKLEIADIYLVNPEGYVVYSAQKNIDFATSLKTGPFKDTALGRVYSKAIASDKYDHVSLSDFERYLPALDDQAAFIASPIQDMLVDDAYEVLGVLVFRIPTTHIDNIMTNQQQWEKIGLGKTGETYLVGKDKKLRSMSRLVHEEISSGQQNLSEYLKETGLLARIKAKKTAFGLMDVQSDALEKGLQGETGVMIATNFIAVESLFAYTPLAQAGLDWAVISEIEIKEAFHAREVLSKSIRNTALLITLVMAGIAVALGWVFSGSITKPILRLNKVVAQIEKDSDLRLRTNINSKDEIGEMSAALDTMLEKFQASLEQVNSATGQLTTASDALKIVTDETTNDVAKQSDEIHQVTSAINEMNATVHEVARSASQAAQSAHDANNFSEEGKLIVQRSIEAIHAMAKEIERATDVISKLHQESDGIGTVLVVIKDIAEQTNLLALNAAIEAARAGEQGRGFAVVADEVRTLASRTQKSTTEIEEMIVRLQEGAQKAVEAIGRGRDQTKTNVEHASSVGEALTTITNSINTINEMNTMIASAAEQQSATTEHIDKNIVEINKGASEIAERANQASERGDELTQLASSLQHMVSQFKT